MGHITRHDINKYKKDYNLSIFIETGTYYGEGIRAAMQYKFNEIYSIEILDKFFNMNVNKFRNNKNVNIIKGNSSDMLPEILKKCDDKYNILFWLDAHLAQLYGVDTNDKKIIFPLEQELINIIYNRDITNDVFIIDDLRIYEDNDFGNGNVTGEYKCDTNIDFVYDLFNNHTIEKDYRDEGYIIIKPQK